MPTKPDYKVMLRGKRFTSWSYSRYRDWKQCPLAAALKHLAKQGERENDAMRRGSELAKTQENFLSKKLAKLPPDLQSFNEEFTHVKAQKTKIVEASWGFTSEWEPCSTTDWDRCKLRVKIDNGYLDVKENILHLHDAKTGKFREWENASYMEQLELYATSGFIMYQGVEEVQTQLWYTDMGVTFPADGKCVFPASEAAALRKAWDKRVAPMLRADTFPARPSRACQWCPFSKSKGGLCRY